MRDSLERELGAHLLSAEDRWLCKETKRVLFSQDIKHLASEEENSSIEVPRTRTHTHS